jgi:tetratricopeptide (TPR) repeat protein
MKLTRGAKTIGFAVTLVVMLALGFLPLFAGPGYEQAFATGLLVPSIAAVVTALENSKARAEKSARRPIDCILHGIEIGFILAGISLLTAILHGARVGFCDFSGGVLGFFLTAFPGVVLGGIWGACVGEVAVRFKRRRLACWLLGIAAPLASALIGLWRFWSSPMVFNFDPFVGYFSGSFYDTVIDPGAPLISYRFGTLATVTFALAAASLLDRDADQRLVRATSNATTRHRAVLAAVSIATSLLITAFGASLGHWSTSASITKDLGGRKTGTRCDVVYPDAMREDQALLLVKDCEEQIAADEKKLGTRGPEHITAFFFRDAGDKKRLMGAGDVYIAKPWRHEVYLNVDTYPHPVLGHEIAHVVAGSFGVGPFRISGMLDGFLPNPGLIEGVAVAASPEEAELTKMTWARAMLDLGILPPMKRVFSLNFLGDSGSKSYAAAGAFIEWLMETYGTDKLHDLYGGASIESVTGKSWDAIDADFRASLKNRPLPDEALTFAKARFDRPGLFSRICPHVVDGLLKEANSCRDGQLYVRAVTLYGEVLAKDPPNYQARFGRAVAEMRGTDHEQGRRDLEAIVDDDKAPRNWLDRASEAMADDDFALGNFAEAAARYRALAATTLDEDAGRTYEVKAVGALDPVARPAIRALLFDDPTHGTDPFLGAARVGAWGALTHDPLADYLIGKNAAKKGEYDDAFPYLERVLQAGAPSPRIGRELVHQMAIAACALGDGAKVEAARKALEDPASPFDRATSGRYESIHRLVDRCIVR